MGERPGRVLEVRVAGDVVPIEGGTRPVAGDAHGDDLGDAGSDEIAAGCAAQIMPNHADETGLPARGRPGLSEIPQRLTQKAPFPRIEKQSHFSGQFSFRADHLHRRLEAEALEDRRVGRLRLLAGG
jgi:hypothetical protein